MNVEDAAQAIDSYYTFQNGSTKALGSIGHMSTFSFHETKNIISGEGGLLGINDEQFIARAEIIWEKGTNRCAFFRGEIDKYSWVDIGSSFLPSDIIAAFLWAQLQELNKIQQKRKKIWDYYETSLKNKSTKFRTATLPSFAFNNSHMFYLIFDNHQSREHTISQLKEKGIMAIFHYIPLHSSPFYKEKYEGEELPNCYTYSRQILRLPFFYSLKLKQQKQVIDTIIEVNS